MNGLFPFRRRRGEPGSPLPAVEVPVAAGLRGILRIVLALSCVPLIAACAGPEKTFRDAHDVVTEVIDLTADTRDEADAKSLYALEDRVQTACRPIFRTAHRQWVFGDIPFYAQVEALMSTHQCRRTVDDARRTLDAYHLKQAIPPK
ncbi:MAG: hypothetical protein R3174_10180 [Gammaproteobacteria bacterium]|nr:hypothetical protein [Gammaproteobacteria bacterium]